MKEIPLTQGKVTFVDDADYDELSKYHWCLDKASNGKLYAYRKEYLKGGKQRTIRMHQQIMGTVGKGLRVHIDHENHNGLDNQRHNLRIATNKQNLANARKSSNWTSKYKGVYWHRATEKWSVEFRVNGKKIYLGLFFSEIEAAKAYNAAAIKHFGEFANLNQI